MLEEFKMSRGLLSSYYIAAIFTYFLFQLPVLKNLVQATATWLISFLKVGFGIVIDGGYIWIVLFMVCFLLTSIIRRFVVYPLGFYINDENAPGWELGVLGILVLGFYIFLLNQVFTDVPMPANTPINVLKFLDGYKNTFTRLRPSSAEEVNTWSIVPWFWYFFPIAFMYTRTLLMKEKK